MYPIKDYPLKNKENIDNLSNILNNFFTYKFTSEEEYYLYRLFPKLKPLQSKDINKEHNTYYTLWNIIDEYKNKIKVLENYGFETITLIAENQNQDVTWYLSDRKQIIDGKKTHIRTFTDGIKQELKYHDLTIGNTYLAKSVSSIVINPSYKFTVNYHFNHDNPKIEIEGNQIIVRNLDFDLNTLPSKEEIQNPEWEFSPSIIEKSKQKSIKYNYNG